MADWCSGVTAKVLYHSSEMFWRLSGTVVQGYKANSRAHKNSPSTLTLGITKYGRNNCRALKLKKQD